MRMIDTIKEAIQLRMNHENERCYWHIESTYTDFSDTMEKLGKLMVLMSNVNLHMEIVIHNNPACCTSGKIIDIVVFGTEAAKAYADSHKDMFGL